jgi:hypothetical protein
VWKPRQRGHGRQVVLCVNQLGRVGQPREVVDDRQGMLADGLGKRPEPSRVQDRRVALVAKPAGHVQQVEFAATPGFERRIGEEDAEPSARGG